jgi:hypothetical protein
VPPVPYGLTFISPLPIDPRDGMGSVRDGDAPDRRLAWSFDRRLGSLPAADSGLGAGRDRSGWCAGGRPARCHVRIYLPRSLRDASPPSPSCIILRLERVGPLILSGSEEDAMATQTSGVWISRPCAEPSRGATRIRSSVSTPPPRCSRSTRQRSRLYWMEKRLSRRWVMRQAVLCEKRLMNE